jgi:hypothetical protein
MKAAWDASAIDPATGPLAEDAAALLAAGFSKVVLSAPKTSNIKGADVPKNHDFGNNLDISGVAGKYGYFHAEITGEKASEQGETASAVSGDGHDLILDFTYGDVGNQDVLQLKGLAGISAADFQALFDVTHSAAGLTISLADDSWSVTLAGVGDVDELSFYNHAVSSGWFV